MIRHKLTPLCLFLLLAPAVSGVSVWAQEDGAEATAEEETQGPPAKAEIAPYDDKLLRLAEVLGSIHYLRGICGAAEGVKWRDVMQELLESEEPGPQRKARLISRFNRGYGAFSQSYRTCTPSAVVAADRYVKEGVRLTSQITTRYGR